MIFAAELIVETAQTITPNHTFQMDLYNRETRISQAEGRDAYNLNCEILPGKILAATGRTASYGVGTGLGAVQAQPARTVNVQDGDLTGLQIKISNNKILDYAALKYGFSLRIHLSGKVIDLCLARPDVKIYWESRGEFVIPLGEHVA